MTKRLHSRRRSRRVLKGGDCGCGGNSSLQHMMSQKVLEPQPVMSGGSGWSGGPHPFFPASALYPSYPLNTHNTDPNNPNVIATSRGGSSHRSNSRRSRRRRVRRTSRRTSSGSSRRLRSRGQRGGTSLSDLFFGNSNNVVYQSNTTPGAELQRAIFLQKGVDSSPFSQMGPSHHNRLYV